MNKLCCTKLRMYGMRILWLLLFCLPIQLFAQDHLVRFNYDNDYFSASDKYYTQGVRLEYIAPVLQQLPIKALLIHPKDYSAKYSGIAVERDGFTPSGIRIMGIPYGDRPYAATMFLSNFSFVLNPQKHNRIFSQLDIGVMGSIVGGKEEQTGIHRSIGNLLPLGWEYQIANDVILNYTIQYEKGIINQSYLTLIGITQARLGTLYTDASAGAMIRLGSMNGYFSNLGISKNTPSKKFQVYGFARVMGKGVVYNATMQGGLFSESIYTLPASSISRVVAQASYGIVVAFKRVQLEYAKYYLTPEYRSGLDHGWGHCGINYCF